MRAYVGSIVVGLSLPLAGAAQAQVIPGNNQPPNVPAAQLEAKKAEAIQKGAAWLASKQEADGSWSYPNAPVQHVYWPMKQGVTALCATALLKTGTDPQSDGIKRAFEFMDKAEMKWTYAVACVLLACEARASWAPPPPPGADRDGTMVRKKPKAKPAAQDLALARKALAFLLANQSEKGLWRYPGPGSGEEDLSNSQYVMLALNAAERLGLDVPKAVYEKAAARLVEVQEQDGPDVEPFPFPGADMTFKELKKIEEEFEKELRQLEKRFDGKPPEAKDEKGQTLQDGLHTMVRAAAQKVSEGTRTRRGAPGERPGIKARGFCYVPADQPRMGAKDGWVTGSMTTSGMVGLLVCKFALEGTPRYERELKPRINQALRDAAGWMAKNYSLDRNPGSDVHHFYYLYGLERAGVLGLLDRIGGHDWYREGVQLFVGRQASEGLWVAIPGGTSGEVPDTCFALLFMARGTTPPVRLPTRVRTGD